MEDSQVLRKIKNIDSLISQETVDIENLRKLLESKWEEIKVLESTIQEKVENLESLQKSQHAYEEILLKEADRAIAEQNTIKNRINSRRERRKQLEIPYKKK
ncbi:hypothetical protein C1645_730831 [Glomus cerebriforme]|uniref:Uncharacterized protein n=1 Tax=Glomus cerebriforme TaxID=658196 RepID=A0A397TMZ9_9GLOM|nr:hypothetical protein C1645_730831 [Glomus cerebriforme]